MLVRASLDLDRDVAETCQVSEPALVGGRRQRVIGNDRDNRRPMAGADLPQMQIGDAVAPGLRDRGSIDRASASASAGPLETALANLPSEYRPQARKGYLVRAARDD